MQVYRIATDEIEEKHRPQPNLDDHVRASRQASVAGEALASGLRLERGREIARALLTLPWCSVYARRSGVWWWLGPRYI